MKTLLDREQLKQTITQISGQIKSDIPPDTDIAVVGIRSRGEILAQRLHDSLSDYFSGQIFSGTLDITLYRDDINEPKEVQPTVRSTEIDFDITDKLILLVDDVLHTGRSVRAAMDALTDFGRPRLMRLAVLVDRVFQAFACLEFWLVGSLDRHRFTSAGIASCRRLSLRNRKRAEANETNFVAARQCLGNCIEHALNSTGRIAL